MFEQVLLFFHDTVGLSWGLSIIALTVAVRAAADPADLKQFRSMQALQQLAPEIKALQEKYKDDKQRLHQEMMKFYQENKVNPFASCLPLVAADAGLHLAVLHAAQGPEGGHLRRCPAEAAGRSASQIAKIGCDQVDPGSAEFLFIRT